MGFKSRNGKNGMLSSRDISLFCSQVVLILKSAIPLQDGIGAIGENIEGSAGKKLIQQIGRSLERDSSFHTALKQSGAFPDYMIHMVEIGEKTGKLDNVMEGLSRYYDFDDTLRRRLHTAILHPLILVFMMAAVVSVLVFKVLPVFNEVFLEMGSDMLATSRSVTRVGMLIGQYALIAIMILILFLIFLLVASKSGAGSQSMIDFFSRFRFTRRLSEKVASAQFATVMSMLLSSGYDPAESFGLIVKIISNKAVVKKVETIQKSVKSGESLAVSMDRVNIFSGIYRSMIQLGEKTGSLDTVMNRLAEIYSEDVNESIERAVSVIEPAMVAVLSVIIGGILLSVMLPLIGIMSSIG